MATEPVEAILRAFRLLELFHQRSALTTTVCAEKLGISRATAHRLLVTLHQAEVLEKDEAGQYRLGLRLFEIGALAPIRKRLCDQSRVPMQRLSGATGMSVNMGVRDGVYAVFIETVPGPRSRVPTRVGHRAPMHATGVGKMLLAHAPSSIVDEIIDAGLHPFTPFTITQAARLKDELAKTKTRGLAVDRQEINLGVNCIAVPVRNGTGIVVAAVSISYPSALISRRHLDEIVPQLRECVSDIEAGLGWQQSIDWDIHRDSVDTSDPAS